MQIFCRLPLFLLLSNFPLWGKGERGDRANLRSVLWGFWLWETQMATTSPPPPLPKSQMFTPVSQQFDWFSGHQRDHTDEHKSATKPGSKEVVICCPDAKKILPRRLLTNKAHKAGRNEQLHQVNQRHSKRLRYNTREPVLKILLIWREKTAQATSNLLGVRRLLLKGCS